MSFKDWLGTYFYNDLNVLPIYFLTVLIILLLLAASIYLHEIGHWLWFKVNKKKNVKILFQRDKLLSWHWQTGVEEDYIGLTNTEYNNLLITGIFMGLLPIAISAFIWIGFTLTIVPYLIGCWSDIKELK